MSETKLFQRKDLDMDFIKENFYKISTEEIAKILGVTRGTVNRRATEMGLRKSKIPFVPYHDEIVVDMDGKYEGYKITSYGRVVNKETNTLLKTKIPKHGYVVAAFFKNKVRDDKRVHQLVARYLIPNPENKPFVNHIDGNKANPHISNLEWVTPKENSEHASAMGLLAVGEDHASKITEKQATIIIFELVSGSSVPEIVKKYNFATRAIVQKIKLKDRWINVWEKLEREGKIPKVDLKGKNIKRPKGEKNHASVLTEVQAKTIIQKLMEGKKIVDILNECPFSRRSQVSAIKRRNSWNYLWNELERATTIETTS
jgi:predicted DNA-binding protein YlxM (UPF0122 family)